MCTFPDTSTVEPKEATLFLCTTSCRFDEVMTVIAPL